MRLTFSIGAKGVGWSLFSVRVPNRVNIRSLSDVSIYRNASLRIYISTPSNVELNRRIAISSKQDYVFRVLTWQSNREAGMFMTALPFSPSYSSLSAKSPRLSAPVQTGSPIDENLLHGEQARPVLFFVCWPIFTEEEILGHA